MDFIPNATESVVLGLIRRGLYFNSYEIPEEVDWEKVFVEAKKQAVHLLVFGALSEDEKKRMPKELLIEWRSFDLYIRLRNNDLLLEQKNVLNWLKGIPCVILKGSSCAACYHNPDHRILGDIDLLLFPHMIDDGIKRLENRGYKLDVEDHQYHKGLSRGRYHVELHFEVNKIPHNQAGENLRSFFSDAPVSVEYQDGLPFLSPDKQAISLLLHTLQHLSGSGVGLRQLCDWATFVDAKLDEETWATLEPALCEFGLLKFAKLLTKVCVSYLGLSGMCLEWCQDVDEKNVRYMMGTIMENGNLGHGSKQYGRRFFRQQVGVRRKTYETIVESCRDHWPICKKVPVLLPFAPLKVLYDYHRDKKTGVRGTFNYRKMMQSVLENEAFFQSINPFDVYSNG